jgi:replication factor A1
MEGLATDSPSKQSFHGDRIQPIASLNPYQSRWAIKARVTNKSEIKVWKNDRGEGKLFSVDLLDQAGGQIKATMFNDAVDKFYGVFQQNLVFVIAKGVLKMANRKFSAVPNDYEMTLNNDAEVELVGEDETILEQKFHFITIDKLAAIPEDDNVDVIGVVKSVSPVIPIISKQSSKQLTKRLVTLMDKSLLSVELTFWGETAEKYGEDIVHQVIAVKAAKVSGYGGGRSLSAMFGSRVFVKPDVDQTQELSDWYATTGKDAVLENITKKQIGSGGLDPRKTFQQLKVEDLGIRGDKAFFFVSRCTPIFFRHDNDKPPWYSACPSPGCNRKVSQDASKMWRCEKCQKTFPTPSPRYILSVHAVDATGDLWLTAFNEVAQLLLGHTAQAVSEFKEGGNDKAYEQVFKDANFKTYLFKCRAKQELREETGETKIRFHVLAATPVNYKQESHFLLEEIAAYLS